jgi:ribosomal protein S27AE
MAGDITDDTSGNVLDDEGGGVIRTCSKCGVQWGSGTLHFRGKRIPIQVSGVGVGTIKEDPSQCPQCGSAEFTEYRPDQPAET